MAGGCCTLIAGGAACTLTLPVTAHAGTYANQPVHAVLNHTGVSTYTGVARLATTTTVQVLSIGTNGIHTNLSSTVPFTWATSDTLNVIGMYEAA